MSLAIVPWQPLRASLCNCQMPQHEATTMGQQHAVVRSVLNDITIPEQHDQSSSQDVYTACCNKHFNQISIIVLLHLIIPSLLNPANKAMQSLPIDERSCFTTFYFCVTADCKSLATHQRNSGKPQSITTYELIIFPTSVCPSSLFKHNKSIVVYHGSACVLQDFCYIILHKLSNPYYNMIVAKETKSTL